MNENTIIKVIFLDDSYGLYKASEVAHTYEIPVDDVFYYCEREADEFGETRYTLDLRNGYAFY